MHRSLTMVSLAMFVIAIAAWAGVWFLFSDTSARLTARAEALSNNGIQSAKQADQIAVHALVTDTVAKRQQLGAVVNTDVVQIAGAITTAGAAAGAQTTIDSAALIASSTTANVSELEFVVQTVGTFAQTWRAAQLFQNLPLPSKVSEVDFQLIPGAGKQAPQWQLTTHIDVLTSSHISP